MEGESQTKGTGVLVPEVPRSCFVGVGLNVFHP